MSYSNENSGALFKNSYKDAPNKPDLTGKVQTCCGNCGSSTEFRVAAWTKRPNGGGDTFLSLAFTPTSESRPAPVARQVSNNDLDDLMGSGSVASPGPARAARPAVDGYRGSAGRPAPTLDVSDDDIPF